MDGIDWDRVVRYYDAHVQTGFDVPFYLERARRAGGPVLEVMCGTGRVLLPLSRAGVPITGVDRAAAFTARLRQKLAREHLEAEVFDADARDFDLGRRFSYVFVAFHAFAEILGQADRARAMICLARHLDAGASLFVSLHNPPIRAAAINEDERSAGTFVLEDGSTFEVLHAWRREGDRVFGHQRYVERANEVVLPIAFDLVSREEMEAHAVQAGLRVVELLGDHDGQPYVPERSPRMLFTFERAR